ncbi:MAG: 1-(5-phosphoribosyl)-5-[(5-phosphoribosylamino)methylideneamino]imidazole-4-carboxamide isomerase [Defluviitaleaceae bacterium]|nr:1-(5-phosphoribosyl)-5-[(5-phosphoribosylamino)methylideneamino]imidazole-4-carboxamide isomerase [Defluviitaleaceae bacterium]
MIVYPAIDIKGGKCVRLKQGNFGEITVFSDEPALVAQDWQSNGASYIHVVDLDGARRGAGYNNTVIKKILSVVDIPIQTGGGIREMKDIEEKFDMGVTRVVLGTAAATSPDLIRQAVEKYGDRIVVSIDAQGDRAAIYGRETLSSKPVLEFCEEVKGLGIKTLTYTDIQKDGMMRGPNLEAIRKVVAIDGIDVIAAGGISSLSDLREMRQTGVVGVIIGKAIYNGAISLRDAIDIVEKENVKGK